MVEGLPGGRAPWLQRGGDALEGHVAGAWEIQLLQPAYLLLSAATQASVQSSIGFARQGGNPPSGIIYSYEQKISKYSSASSDVANIRDCFRTDIPYVRTHARTHARNKPRTNLVCKYWRMIRGCTVRERIRYILRTEHGSEVESLQNEGLTHICRMRGLKVFSKIQF